VSKKKRLDAYTLRWAARHLEALAAQYECRKTPNHNAVYTAGVLDAAFVLKAEARQASVDARRLLEARQQGEKP
jgi:hypothetical protein